MACSTLPGMLHLALQWVPKEIERVTEHNRKIREGIIKGKSMTARPDRCGDAQLDVLATSTQHVCMRPEDHMTGAVPWQALP